MFLKQFFSVFVFVVLFVGCSSNGDGLFIEGVSVVIGSVSVFVVILVVDGCCDVNVVQVYVGKQVFVVIVEEVCCVVGVEVVWVLCLYDVVIMDYNLCWLNIDVDDMLVIKCLFCG